MRLLLDTHTLLWWADDDQQLSDVARELLSDPANELFFSAARAWEVAIKAALGKLEIDGTPVEFLSDQLKANGISELPVTMKHIAFLHGLPAHHKDPFDRILVAQANAEALTILSNDAKMKRYPVSCIW